MSGLKCHYEQYFPPAQLLLPGGGFCATSSVFPFPLWSIKICISVCMCSAQLLLAAAPGLAEPGWPLAAPLQPRPGQACALPGCCLLPALGWGFHAPDRPAEPAGWDRGPPSSHLRAQDHGLARTSDRCPSCCLGLAAGRKGEDLLVNCFGEKQTKMRRREGWAWYCHCRHPPSFPRPALISPFDGGNIEKKLESQQQTNIRPGFKRTG